MADNGVKLPEQPSSDSLESRAVTRAEEGNIIIAKARRESELKGIARHDQLLDHLHGIMVVSMYVVVLVLAGFVVWYVFTAFWHMLTPFGYLGDAQANMIIDRLLSGSFGAILVVLANGLARYFARQRQ